MLVCVFVCAFLHMRPRVQRAPGLPCVPLVFWGERHANLGQTMSRECCCSSSSANADDPVSEELVIEPRTRGVLDTPPSRSMTVSGGASARWSGWLLTFVPGKPVSTLHQAGWLLSEACFWGATAPNLCSRGHVGPNASPGLVLLQFGHQAKSGFRLGPGAYTLPY
jgi:hypothetical protein